MTGRPRGSLEPAAIRFTLKHLQESTRWSGCFLLVILFKSLLDSYLLD